MSSPTRDRVLVTGATGYIGGRLVPRLLAEGYPVVCLARDPGQLAQRHWAGAEIAPGDLLDERSLEVPLRGVDTAYYLIHSMNGGEAEFAERDRRAAAGFAAAARRAGVRHIIYLGGLGVPPLSAHLASRQETGRILRASGIPVTEFRAAVIVGSGSTSFELIRYLVERLPMMICPRWVNTPCQPIAVDDVLRYLAGCPAVPEAHGRILEIGGRDILTYREMMLEYAAARGLRRRLLNVPLLTPRLSSYWCDLVTPIPASIARPLIEGLRTEVTVRDPSARKLFDFEPLAYREALARALDRAKDGPETVWCSSLASVEARTVPPRQLGSSEGMIREHRSASVEAAAEDVFAVISGLGGKRGWLYADALWRLRGAADRLLGGVGLRRGRRHPDQLRVGDPLDFWRVETVTAPCRLLLRAEMKLPGRAWLQWTIEPLGIGRSTLIQTALFEPQGLAGLAYWYALYPFHALIFRGMLRAVARRAARAGSRSPSGVTPAAPEIQS
jgi:uncharacterized protein YbjT (DUF2867 family)